MLFAVLLRLFILIWLLGIVAFFLVKLPSILKGETKQINVWVVLFFPFLCFTHKGREQIKKEFK